MYSLDKRKIAIYIYSLLHSLRKTAILLQVSHSTISRWLKHPEKKQYYRSLVSKTDIIVPIIKTTILNDPFISIFKLKNMINDTMKILISKELIRIAIKRLGFSKKKARFYGVSSNLKEKTESFLSFRNNYINQGRRFVSIDETSFGRSGLQTYGYSVKGKPLYIRKPVPRITTTSVTCAVTSDGFIYFDKCKGSMNTNKYLDFLKTVPFKKLDVVLMDNVSFHHSKIIKEYIHSLECNILYVPPYSPWFNPIELCFSIIKRDYYKHQDIARAIDTLKPKHIFQFFDKSINCTGF